MKRISAFVLALVMMLSLAVPGYATEEKPFDNSNFYTVGDYTVHYRTYLPQGEIRNQILLIHGFCLSTASMEGIAQQYADAGYKVVCVDVPNFGYSSRENSQTKKLDREEVIHSLVRSLGGTWIAGGHSMGGGIALNLATDYQDTYTGLVLFAPQTSAEVSAVVRPIVGGTVMQTIYNVILKIALMFPSTVRGLVEMSFSDKAYADSYDLSRITDPLKIKGTGAGITIMASHAKGPDFEKISQLNIPSVVITAKEDKVASAENLEAIIQALGENAVIYECEKGGHMMMEYDSALVAEKTLPIIEMCA